MRKRPVPRLSCISQNHGCVWPYWITALVLAQPKRSRAAMVFPIWKTGHEGSAESYTYVLKRGEGRRLLLSLPWSRCSRLYDHEIFMLKWDAGTWDGLRANTAMQQGDPDEVTETSSVSRRILRVIFRRTATGARCDS